MPFVLLRKLYPPLRLNFLYFTSIALRSGSMNHTKQSIRQEIRKALAELKQDELVRKSKQLSARLNRPMQQGRDLVWGVYSPLKDEPKWQMEIENLKAFKLAYPRSMVSGEMVFFRCHENELVIGKGFGVEMMGPPPKSLPAHPEALLIPALGFTLTGERIGRGKGHYDRVLKGFTGIKIGVCFEKQLCEGLPVEEHDQKVQVVVTERRIISCGESLL